MFPRRGIFHLDFPVLGSVAGTLKQVTRLIAVRK
jgi:hypothetical protein